MYLKHEEKSVPTQTVHRPMYSKTTFGQLPSQPPSSSAAQIAQATGAQSPSAALMQSVYGGFPSSTQATYGQPSSLLHPTQSVYDGAPSTSHANYYNQPSSMIYSPTGRPPAMPFQPRSYDGGPSIVQATYGQPSSTSQHTYDLESLLARTSLAQPTTFGKFNDLNQSANFRNISQT